MAPVPTLADELVEIVAPLESPELAEPSPDEDDDPVELDVELETEEEVELELPLDGTEDELDGDPPPLVPPRPRPLRLPRICGASKPAARSAVTEPVSRMVRFRSPTATVALANRALPLLPRPRSFGKTDSRPR